MVSWAFARVGVHRPSLRLPYLGTNVFIIPYFIFYHTTFFVTNNDVFTLLCLFCIAAEKA